MNRLIAAVALSCLPFAALAAGSNDSEPPKETKTSTDCTGSQVWDEKTQTCTEAKSGALDNDTLFGAVRELAHAGRPDDALAVLAAMSEGDSDRVLTYKGFASRKAGRVEEGMAFYAQALAQNPRNLLARSYMGQGLVEQGETAMAQQQLALIRAQGGAGTWAEASLARAIETGITYTF